jgi:aspartate/methionine/tyrosine aminotransferase
MLFYAASIAMIAAATYCMQRKLTVSLIDPCFDNLHDILKSYRIPLLPLHEEIFHEIEDIYPGLEATATGDIICLVDPNNPTGFSLAKHGRAGFEQIIRFCQEKKKTLLIDLCFAAFALADARFGRLDLYQLLEDSGISYMAIEDTGKTWPLQDAKCALLTVSTDLYEPVFGICTSILLNVSPFILNMVNEYVIDSGQDHFASITRVLEGNRDFLQAKLADSVLEYCQPVVNTSVAWLRILDPGLTASMIQKNAYRRQVYVLPGNYFFWSRRELGERYIRIALARDPALFRAAVTKFAESLHD